MRNIAIILAGGSGKRFGADMPKQFLLIAGKRIIEHSIEAFERNTHIDEICVVSNPDFLEETQKIVAQAHYQKVRHVIAGGQERSDSTINALRLYKAETANLIFHDAVRPLVSQRIIDDVCRALKTQRAVNVTIPSADTLIVRQGDYVKQVPDRRWIERVQTPQGFHVGTIVKAYAEALKDPAFKATDDCGVVTKYLPDVPVFLVAGEERNQRLTYREDLPVLENLYNRSLCQSAETAPSSAAPSAVSAPDSYLREYRQRELRPLQLKMLEMLTTITDILERNNIPYWLEGGTLLGAMRHGGFIPWDDDVDIDILAADTERMKEALRRELPPTMILPDPPAKTPIYKVRDLNSFFVEFADDFRQDYAKGVYVDIFPKVECPSFPRGFTKRIAKGYCRSNSILHKQHYYSWRSVAELFYFGTKRALCGAIWHTASLFFPKGKYVSMMLKNNGCGLMHRKDKLFPLKKVRFEDREFFAPADPDFFLRECFGNWRELPPENQRQVHSIYYDVELL